MQVPSIGTRLPAPPVPAWLAHELSGLRRSRIQVGRWAMHVMESGPPDDPNPLVMVHGNPTWGFLWRRVVRALGSGRRVILPDLVGLGLSDHPADPACHTLVDHAAWLSALLQSLALQRIDLVVQDWGGPIGVLAQRQSGVDMRGLVVLNTVLFPPREGFRPTLFHRSARWPGVSEVMFRGLGFPQNVLAVAQGDPRSLLGVAGRAYRWPLRRWSMNAAPLALARMVPDGPDHPSMAPLQEVGEHVAAWRGPTAIVWGDRDPILGRVRGHMERVLPHARVWRTSAGHFLPEEVPEVIAEAIAHVHAEAGAAGPAES
jgi:haloalkane dehalogenase